mmetsp:Transcript_124332/g.359526  ORF Transcript_124332/g.359526 Transcript_124332/m.359526 type:complete len:270 (+) Transcript_124332:512-1321(+)
MRKTEDLPLRSGGLNAPDDESVIRGDEGAASDSTSNFLLCSRSSAAASLGVRRTGEDGAEADVEAEESPPLKGDSTASSGEDGGGADSSFAPPNGATTLARKAESARKTCSPRPSPSNLLLVARGLASKDESGFICSLAMQLSNLLPESAVSKNSPNLRSQACTPSLQGSSNNSSKSSFKATTASSTVRSTTTASAASSPQVASKNSLNSDTAAAISSNRLMTARAPSNGSLPAISSSEASWLMPSNKTLMPSSETSPCQGVCAAASSA